MSRKPIQESEIIDCLNIHYGIKAHAVQLLALGADMNASVYKADSVFNSYFVKIKYDINLSLLDNLIIHKLENFQL